MSSAKKRLEAALRKTDKLSDGWFGSEKASLEDLPSIRKNWRVRKNIYIEQNTAEVLEEICDRHRV